MFNKKVQECSITTITGKTFFGTIIKNNRYEIGIKNVSYIKDNTKEPIDGLIYFVKSNIVAYQVVENEI